MNRKENKQDKIAVVTGGSSGIGAVLVKRLAYYGYKVICVSRSAPEESEECDFFSCDLSIPERAEETAQAILAKYGKIDLLVNNAGLGVSGATELIPQESIRYVMEVDYFAPLLFTRALLPAMPRNSKIVMIGSACALFALPYRGVYCSAKAALNMLAFSLRMELKKSGITVTTVCPGDIRSRFTRSRLKYTQSNARYGDSVLAAQEKIDNREHKRMKVQSAGKKIARIAVKKKGALYIVGAKYKFLYFLSKIFPQSWMIGATNAMFNPKK